MSSSNHFIPGIYQNQENMEISKYNFSLAKEIQITFWMCDCNLQNCHACCNCGSKIPFIGNKMCDNCIHKAKIIPCVLKANKRMQSYFADEC